MRMRDVRQAAANCGEKGGAAVAGGGGKGKGGGAVPKKQQEPKQQPQQRQQRERAESWQQSPQQEAKPVPRWREAEPPAGNAWEQGPPRPRTSPSLGGSETSSQVSSKEGRLAGRLVEGVCLVALGMSELLSLRCTDVSLNQLMQQQAARDVPPLEMQATNPMEVVLLQQQQAKQEAEAAGLDFDSMVRA